MEAMPSGLGPEDEFSPQLSRTGKPESVDKLHYATGQRVTLPGSDGFYGSASASSSSHDIETNRNGGNCDEMAEKWRLIRLGDKHRSQKKIYPTHDVYAARFGENYSKFYKAFQQGISIRQAPKPTATTIPAKRSAALSEQAPKRRRQDDISSPPHSDRGEARSTPAQRSAASATTASMGAKPNEFNSPSDVAIESSITPRSRSYSDAKEQTSKRKGVGLYAGNWEYVPNEEKIPEYLTVAQKTADFEGRTTRRAYAKMTSTKGAGDSGRVVDLASRSEVRNSGRARDAVDYARLSGSEDNAREIATPEQLSPSTSASSTANRSGPMPNRLSGSMSTSSAINTEQPERPKLSWNAIVYTVLATSETPLTPSQLMQGIKDRYPFFKSPSQDKVLESGVKNPLYFHEAFCKGEIINGKQTWGLRPGDWVDKKTGEVLTPRPRHTISSSRPPEQAHETEDRSPVDLKAKLSHSHSPRSSNPRFGREILNSPEIPDSQDAKASTSGHQEAEGPIATEHAPHSEHPYEQAQSNSRANSTRHTSSTDSTSSATHSSLSSSASEAPKSSHTLLLTDQDFTYDNSAPVDRLPALDEALPSLKSVTIPLGVLWEPSGTQELFNAAHDPSKISFAETSLSGQKPQPRHRWVDTTGSPMNTTSSRKPPLVAGAKVQNVQNAAGAIDDGASATAAQLPGALQATQPHVSSIQPSPGEIAHGSSYTTAQTVTISVPPLHTVSPTPVPTLFSHYTTTSENPPIAPALPRHL